MSATIKAKNNARLFNNKLEKVTVDGIARATVFYHSRCRLIVNVSNPLVKLYVKIESPSNPGKFYWTRRPTPSQPGEAPRKQTGWGQQHILMEINRRRRWGRVGVGKNAIYMLYLELGTRRIKRRPWLVKTLMDNIKMIGLLAATGGK